MKLAEAASILGISLEDVTTDSLKQQYRKLIISWDPDTVSSVSGCDHSIVSVHFLSYFLCID
jgi:preprotein translocase subunit Sec63